MSAVKVRDKLCDIVQSMADIAPYRNAELFNTFLPKGYTSITLSTVSEAVFSDLLRAKVCLGTLITLYDDFADRPSQYNPQLLELLYQFGFEKSHSMSALNAHDRHVLVFAQSLFDEMNQILVQLPHYQKLREILNFDLMQFYSANRFSSLMMLNPSFNNSLENRLYAHHNMGMVMVAMMDVMSIEELNFSELGYMREVFLMGQRMGRIFNVLATRKREALDGDVTGELSNCKNEHEVDVCADELATEVLLLRHKISSFEPRIKSFSVGAYLAGLEKVQKLHKVMEGVI